MEQGTFGFADEGRPPPVKLCECGCGKPAPISPDNDKARGYVKGQPRRFIKGHRIDTSLTVEVGQRFSRGVVIDAHVRIPRKDQAGTIRGARLLCDCGTEYVAALSSLRNENTRSCGCLFRETIVNRNKVVLAEYNRKPSAAGRQVLCVYKRGAQTRDLDWLLSDEEFYALTSQDCHYCGQPPSMVRTTVNKNGYDFTYNGIDRVDNTRGYDPENVVACCLICNRAKRDMPFGEFMAWIARLTAHHWFHPEQTPSRLLREVAG